jgi:hypothetical protein
MPQKSFSLFFDVFSLLSSSFFSRDKDGRLQEAIFNLQKAILIKRKEKKNRTQQKSEHIKKKKKEISKQTIFCTSNLFFLALFQKKKCSKNKVYTFVKYFKNIYDARCLVRIHRIRPW